MDELAGDAENPELADMRAKLSAAYKHATALPAAADEPEPVKARRK